MTLRTRFLAWVVRRLGPSSGTLCMACGRYAGGRVGGREPYHDVVVCDCCEAAWGVSRRGTGPEPDDSIDEPPELADAVKRYRERQESERET